MTVHLPDDLKRFLQAEVHRGRFASEEEALAQAVRLLRQQLGLPTVEPDVSAAASPPGTDPLLGAFRDAAGELDEVVAEAMAHRERQPWRVPDGA